MAKLTTVAVSMFMRCDATSCGAANELRAIVDRYRCRSCLQVRPMSPERWGDLLDAAVHDLPRMQPGTEIERDLEDRAPGRVVTKNTSVACASCKASVSLDAITRARSHGHCVCAGCGAKLLLRPTPPAYAPMLPGVTHLLGEDIAIVANPEPPVIPPGEEAAALCPSCGGGLTIDGTSRAVRCKYCANMIVLPGSLWAHLRPNDDERHIFYLVHDDSAPRSALRTSLAWGRLDDVVGDARGNLYGMGEDADVVYEPRAVVFSLDPLGRTRWVRRDLGRLRSAMLACRADGTVVVAKEDDSLALLLRSDDGDDAGKLGKAQPAGSPAHTLDLKGARALAIDIDDTVIFVKSSRLVRCNADGNAAAMWPPHKALFGLRTIASKTPPFTDENVSAPSFEDLDDFPSIVPDVKICVGLDGSLYLWSGKQAASFDRTGKKRWLTTLPIHLEDLVGDASGIAYAVCNDGERLSLVRLSTSGAVESVLEGNEFLEGRLVARRDGTLVTIGGHGRALALRSDGTRLWERGRADDDD